MSVFFFFFAFLINDEMMTIYFMSLFYNHVCFHRLSKAHQNLCLLLCTVMPSLNKFSYLILSHVGRAYNWQWIVCTVPNVY